MKYEVLKKNKSGGGQKGISILLAVLVLSVVLSIGLGISLISLQQTKMTREIGYSVIAFFAADSGIENVLFMATPVSIPETLLPNGAKYKVDVYTPDGDCDADNFCIKSIGTYKETSRAIEIRY